MEVRGLSLQIGARILVERLNLTLAAGECWCIIGRNGAGKSSLLRTLAGLRQPQAGSIFLQQKNVHDWPLLALAQARAFLPQARSDAFAYRVIDSVLTARHPYQGQQYWESEQDLQLAHAALAQLDVAELAERDVRSLSGGERQRVAIAAVLAQDAQLMLLDEPATALDLAHQVSVMQLFSEQCSQQNKTVVMVSHDLNLAHRVATHALLLHGDGSWQAGRAAEVLRAEPLSVCLGHDIDSFKHQGQTIFLPKQIAKEFT